MDMDLKAACEEMNGSQRKCFDLVYNAHPGTVTNFTLATEGCLSYTGRISEANEKLRAHGWEISCKRSTSTKKSGTFLYRVRRASKGVSDEKGQYILPIAESL